jgi:hypothetical protein
MLVQNYDESSKKYEVRCIIARSSGPAQKIMIISTSRVWADYKGAEATIATTLLSKISATDVEAIYKLIELIGQHMAASNRVFRR